MKPLRIGTRGSPLALWQARAVAAAITRGGGPPCTLVEITTTGDRLAQAALAEVGGRTVFVKEIDEALAAGAIHAAVHSAKDLPSERPSGLSISAALARDDPRDVLVARPSALPAGFCPDSGAPLIEALGPRLTIGTGSVRRIAQLRRRFNGVTFTGMRGNVGTRLSKLDAGACDVLVLAAAGIHRLGLADRIGAYLSLEECVPAPGQGIVAIEARTEDHATGSMLKAVGDADAMTALTAERALLQTLGGNCHVPIGAVATCDGIHLTLTAVVAALDGSRAVTRRERGLRSQAEELGRALGRTLLDNGAASILAAAQPAKPA